MADSSSEVLGSDNSSWPLTSRQHLLIQHMPKTGGTSFRKMVFRDAARLGKTWCRTPVTSCFLHRQPMPRWRRPQGRCTYWRGFRRRAPRQEKKEPGHRFGQRLRTWLEQMAPGFARRCQRGGSSSLRGVNLYNRVQVPDVSPGLQQPVGLQQPEAGVITV